MLMLRYPVWYCYHLADEEGARCHGLFVLRLDVIGRLCSVILVLPGHPIYFLCPQLLKIGVGGVLVWHFPSVRLCITSFRFF